IEITITDAIVPTFDVIDPLCLNAEAPILPTTSNNNITGSWNAVVTTDAVGTTTYTFTPDEGQCAGPVEIEVTITDAIVPVFDAIDPLCLDAEAAILSLTSTNGITGKWDPAVVNTSVIGTATYTFTPDEGQCAGPVEIEVTITDAIVPVFDAIDPLCLDAEAPILH